MRIRKLTGIIVFILTAIYFLADRSSAPVTVHNDLSRTGTVYIKHKEDKCVKPFSKIKKVKLKVRYKASEVKFALNTYYVPGQAQALVVETVPVNHQYHVATGFHFTRKLRGPPAII